MLLKTSLRSFLAHKGRLVLSLVAVVLSVAFVAGTLVFSTTASKTFDRLFSSTAPDVLVTRTPAKEVAGTQQGAKPLPLPASSVRKVAGLSGVKSAAGQISVTNATLINPKTNKPAGPVGGSSTTIGAWVPVPRSPMEVTSGKAPSGSGRMMIDADTADHSGLGIGDRVQVINSFGTFDYTISGIATFKGTNPGSGLAYLDVPTAQKDLLGASDVYTSISAFGDGSVSDDRIKSSATAALGKGFDVKTADEQTADGEKDVGSYLTFMKYLMLGFAGISLLVGGFLIVNTFSMLVAQRTREIGLLRALGGSRRQVNLSVLVEALLLAAIGSTLGMLAGLGVAQLLIVLMGRAGMKISSSLEFDASIPIASYAVGVVVTVLAAWIPARRAGRFSPMAALREHGTPGDRATTRIRAGAGLLLSLLGGVLLAYGAGGTGSSPAVGAGVVLTLIGFVVLGPVLATGVIRALGAALPAMFGPSGKLAQRNAMRNPRRTGATAAALMIGLAVVTGVSVISSSMVRSTNAQIDDALGADYLVQGDQTGLTPGMLKAAEAAEGIDHITEEKHLPATLTAPDGDSNDFTVVAVSKSFTKDFHFPVKDGSGDNAISRGISVDEDYADLHHLRIGDKLKIDYGDGHRQSVPVEVITTAGSTLFDKQFYIGIPTVARAIPAAAMPADTGFYGAAASGADKDRTYDALQKALDGYPQLTVQDQAGFKALYLHQVNTLLYLVYALLGLSIIVAVLGVINTLALSVVERTREIGLLRAIGLSRRQLRRMIRLESVVIALFGALLGTGLGLCWGISTQRLMKGQGLQLLSVPVVTIAAVLALSAVVGLLAALVPAFRAGRMNVLGAIASD
ncbi:FtsX-like permease family protein [Streptomyces sp. NPDC088921]|uniref:ABC transporter permease n=1 Tax=unclassified Streptomyces TaxID=2593676 RepID=UPI00343F7B23